ncbi:hypothetical protein QFZ89_000213 [Paraburkholderia youngii]
MKRFGSSVCSGEPSREYLMKPFACGSCATSRRNPPRAGFFCKKIFMTFRARNPSGLSKVYVYQPRGSEQASPKAVDN